MKRNVTILNILVALALTFSFAGCSGPDQTPSLTLSYDANGGDGSVPASQTVQEGKTIKIAEPGNLSRPEKKFIGWNTFPDGNGRPYLPGDSRQMYFNDIVLYAQWGDRFHTLSYDANGGEGDVPAGTRVEEGTDITVADSGDLSHTGNYFNGWNTLSDGMGEAYASGDSITIVDAPITLYAQWGVSQYTLSYDANGAEGDVPASRTVDYNTEVYVLDPPSSLIFTGYAFTGWNTKIDGNGTRYAYPNRIPVTEDIVLYAMWISQYTLSYDANGADGNVPAAQTVNENTEIGVAEPSYGFNYPGKTFDGWNTQADGSGTPYAANAAITVTEDIVLYAQWLSIQYTVTYDSNGGDGTAPPPDTVDWGESVILPGGLQRNGYFFGGWNARADSTGTIYQVGAPFEPDRNSTLYAFWIAPRISTTDADKEVTDDGTVRIHLMIGVQYIYDGTEEYRLYRSDTQTDGYSLIDTVNADQLILEDTAADWLTEGDYYYKVAACADGTEVMSTNGVRINKVRPRVYMRYYNDFGGGSCAVQLLDESGDGYQWGPVNLTATEIRQLLIDDAPPPPGNYTVKTSTLLSPNWNTITGQPLVLKTAHTYTIAVLSGPTVASSFVKSNWVSFTP